MEPQQVNTPEWMIQAVPGLLVAAVLGIGGLFMQVTRVDQSMAAVREDIAELKNDARERLTGLEERVRTLEMKTR
jgi:hypothetical protein